MRADVEWAMTAIEEYVRAHIDMIDNENVDRAGPLLLAIEAKRGEVQEIIEHLADKRVTP